MVRTLCNMRRDHVEGVWGGLGRSHSEALIKPGLAALLGPALAQALALHQSGAVEEVVDAQS